MYFFKVSTPYILITFAFTMFLLLRSSQSIDEDVEVKYEYVDESAIRLEYDPLIKGFVRVYA